MVRLNFVLCRVPVIRFRKGGAGQPTSAAPGSPATSRTSAQAPTAASSQGQPAAAMSTSSIPDIDLPARYRRQPLSQEEIDHINGGGIV